MRYILGTSLLCLTLVGCSGSDSNTSAGGESSQGGTTGGRGGNGGQSASGIGGALGGQSSSSPGQVAGGATIASGGQTTMAATGGALDNGGAAATGGRAAGGTAPSIGGNAAGGASNGVGGSATGGRAIGGTAPSTGGHAAGGASNGVGGSATGGRATAGTVPSTGGNTLGMSGGGASAGGKASTGGTASTGGATGSGDATGTGGSTCNPSCTNKTCGSDGCNGTCGGCKPSQMCGANGTCQTKSGSGIVVDASSQLTPISPDIYGVAFATDTGDDSHNVATLDRWGGDAETSYNWQKDMHNSGGDWYCANYVGSGHDADTFAQTNKSWGLNTLMTIPITGWLANVATSSDSTYSATLGQNLSTCNSPSTSTPTSATCCKAIGTQESILVRQGVEQSRYELHGQLGGPFGFDLWNCSQRRH